MMGTLRGPLDDVLSGSGGLSCYVQQLPPAGPAVTATLPLCASSRPRAVSAWAPWVSPVFRSVSMVALLPWSFLPPKCFFPGILDCRLQIFEEIVAVEKRVRWIFCFLDRDPCLRVSTGSPFGRIVQAGGSWLPRAPSQVSGHGCGTPVRTQDLPHMLPAPPAAHGRFCTVVPCPRIHTGLASAADSLGQLPGVPCSVLPTAWCLLCWLCSGIRAQRG